MRKFILIGCAALALVFQPLRASAAINDLKWQAVTQTSLDMINSGRVEEGLDLVRRSIKQEPNEPAWHALLGEQLMQLGSGAGARDTVDPKKRLDEAEKEFKKAKSLFKSPQQDGAIAQCERMLEEIARLKKIKAAKAPVKAAPAMPAAAAPRPAPQASSGNFERFKLRNGSWIEGVVVEKDAQGFWLEAAPGAKAYVKNAELASGTAAVAAAPAPAKASAAEETPVSRPCTTSDVTGDWVKFSTAGDSPLALHRERFKFHPDGFVQHSQILGNVDASVVDATFAAVKPSIRFEIDAKGRMLWHYPDYPSRPGIIDCGVDASNGDLRLTRYRPDAGAVIDRITLRRRR